MSLDTISPAFCDIARYLVQAEHSPSPTERADAIDQLKDLRGVMESELRDAEASMRAGINRNVEAAALRSAVATLAKELTQIEAAELIRTPLKNPQALLGIARSVRPG